MNITQLLALITTLLTRVGSNRVNASDILEAVNAVVSYFATQLADIIPTWSAASTYNSDGTGSGKYSKYTSTTGVIRLFESKTLGNINHAPPTDPGITENAYWIEVSASASASIPEWAAGIYGPELVIVFHNHSVDGRGFYILTEAARPYSSTNIETEITAGDWAIIGAGSAAVPYQGLWDYPAESNTDPTLTNGQYVECTVARGVPGDSNHVPAGVLVFKTSTGFRYV